MRNWECFRLFGENRVPLPDVSALDHDIDSLVELLCNTRNRGNRQTIPAGYTYFGQFIDHDLTLIMENSLPPDPQKPLDLNEISLGRNPTLDLDSLYGGGLEDAIIPFDKDNGMFILDDPDSSNPLFNDLPRDPKSRPLIGDSRNDENLLVGQIQVFFMRLHNRIIDDLLLKNPGRGAHSLFNEAHEEVIKLYQYLVIHDFAKQILEVNVYEKVLLAGAGELSQAGSSFPKLALEFASAAFRLHSMVRSEYHLNSNRKVSLKELFDITRPTRKHKYALSNTQFLDPDDFVHWGFFFRFSHYPGFAKQCQFAQTVSYTLQQELLALDIPGESGPVNMVNRTNRRGFHHNLCSGQEIYAQLARRFGKFAESDLHLSPAGLSLLNKLSKSNSVKQHTPLWTYLMFEAWIKLGVMGSWIVADTLKTAARNADIQLPDLFNAKNKHFYPPLLQFIQAQGRDTLSIEDVIFYTYHEPNIDIEALVLTTQKERKMTNTYEDWFGIAEVGAVSVFVKGNSDDASARVPDSVKNELESYLPQPRGESQEQYLVARIPSKHDGKDVLKLYVNETWQGDVYRELNKLNFVAENASLDRDYYNNYAGVEALRSIENFTLSAGYWKSDSPVLLLKNVPGDGKFTVRIEFTNSASGDAIDAYWCWP